MGRQGVVENANAIRAVVPIRALAREGRAAISGTRMGAGSLVRRRLGGRLGGRLGLWFGFGVVSIPCG